MIIVSDKCGRNWLLRPGDILNICRGNKDKRSQNFHGDNWLLFSLLFVIFLRFSSLCITSFCFHIYYNLPPSEKMVLCHSSSSYTIYFQYLAFLLAMCSYTVKTKVRDIPVPNWDVTYQTLPGRETFFLRCRVSQLALVEVQMSYIRVCIMCIFSAHYQCLPLHKKDST